MGRADVPVRIARSVVQIDIERPAISVIVAITTPIGVKNDTDSRSIALQKQEGAFALSCSRLV